MKNPSIAIFGSAFNPPTLGHADAINYLLQTDKFDLIYLVPSYSHAFAKQMLDYTIRTEMLNAFVSDLKLENVKTLSVEHEIAAPNTPVYTYDLLTYLSETTLKAAQLTFVIGPDNQENWHKFYKSDAIVKKWGLCVVPERKKVRSSLVRSALTEQKPVSDMLTHSVEQIINSRQLYR